jgi:hypothetical protein
MKAINQHVFAFRFILLLFAILPAAQIARAQADVEIEVVGPWDYVSDSGNRIMLIAPNSNHDVALFTGEDSNLYGSSSDIKPKPGLHRLDLDLADCGNPAASTDQLYPLKLSAQAVANALNAKTKRYGFSLPKPCYYETYQDARAKIADALPLPAKDDRFTTWMVLHYRVNTLSATLALNPDNGVTSSKPLPFGSNTGSSTKAISIIMEMNAGKDYICDRYSAQSVDDAKTLWGVQTLYRQFPVIDAHTEQQTARYSSTCSPSVSWVTPHPSAKLATTIVQEIRSLRKDVKDLKPKDASSLLDLIQKNVSQYWNNHVPADQQQDINKARKVIEDLMTEHMEKIDVGRILSLELYMMTPGRTDCHKMQFNINSAVP